MKKNHSNQSIQALSIELSRALDDIAIKSMEMEVGDLIAAYEKFEKSYLPKVETNEFVVRETKRRVAEMKFYLTVDRDCSYETCEKYFNEIEDLGFTNLEKKSNVYLIFFRYCQKVGCEDKAVDLLREIILELDNELSKADSAVYRQIHKQAMNLLAR